MRKIGCMLLSLCGLYIVTTGIAVADMYKWTDKDGNVHFGDQPPADNKADEVNIKQAAPHATSASLVKSNTKQVDTKKPMRRIDDAEVRSVKLDKIVLSLNSSSSSDVAIGTNYSTCERETAQGARFAVNGNVYAPDKVILVPDEGVLKDKGFSAQFIKVFKDYDYRVIVPSTELFDVGNEQSPDLLVGAVIKEMSVNMCRDWRRQGSTDTVTVASYVKIGWQVYDPLNKKIVYETTTEGSEHKVISSKNNEEVMQTDARSFGNAATNLLAQPEFIKVLLGGVTANLSSSAKPVSLKVLYGNGVGNFVAKAERLKSGTATVRTANGHGSGMIVSQDGYLITNAHVVGNSSNVLVIINDKQHRATVVRSNGLRDVALVKIDAPSGLAPLVISKNPIKTGETIYVIGTPLDENLSHTVTRGILSSERSLNKKKYYQTDAAVNPGNSGGPAFNSNGEVIGVTVSGIFAKDGGSLNINFIIPIEEALSSLGI